MSLRHVIGTALLLTVGAVAMSAGPSSPDTSAKGCPKDDSGLTLLAGFCATVFADGIGHARHLAVNSNGVVYANTWSGRDYDFDKVPEGGFLVALQDKSGAGKADRIERFGDTERTGGAGGTGIGLYKGALYAEINDRIVRYALSAEASVPPGAPETIVSKLPLGGDHPMHPSRRSTSSRKLSKNSSHSRSASRPSGQRNPQSMLLRPESSRLSRKRSVNRRAKLGCLTGPPLRLLSVTYCR